VSSLDDLPQDQRAVLALVLQLGRSYDEIARLLGIDRAAVRRRALAAVDALGPPNGVDSQRRALIADYLLGQLPPGVAQEIRERLATSTGESAWARGVASGLVPLANKPLPEIAPGPDGGAAPDAREPADRDALGTAPDTPPDQPKPPRSSRLGGMILLAGAALAAAAVVVVIVTNSGGRQRPSNSHAAASAQTAAAASNTTSASTTALPTPTAVAAFRLTPPGRASNAAGIAEVLRQGTTKGIAIVAEHMTPNKTKPPNAYAVWLYNSARDARLLGFVNPGVGKNGRLSAASRLPGNAAHFKRLVITLETHAYPKTPGTIVLAGQLSGLS
jgi:hypothetical protein